MPFPKSVRDNELLFISYIPVIAIPNMSNRAIASYLPDCLVITLKHQFDAFSDPEKTTRVSLALPKQG